MCAFGRASGAALGMKVRAKEVRAVRLFAKIDLNPLVGAGKKWGLTWCRFLAHVHLPEFCP